MAKKIIECPLEIAVVVCCVFSFIRVGCGFFISIYTHGHFIWFQCRKRRNAPRFAAEWAANTVFRGMLMAVLSVLVMKGHQVGRMESAITVLAYYIDRT